MTTSRALPALLSVACLAFTAGCGGDDKKGSGSTSTDAAAQRGYDSPVTTVQAYAKAFGAGDYATACTYISSTSLDKMKAAGNSCEDTFAKGGPQVVEAKKQFAGATVGAADVTGDKGTVKVTTAAGPSIDLPVVREADGWKVTT
jgi:hypothetical protein